jgi:hypothetical protein
LIPRLSHTFRVAVSLYPWTALLSAADRLANVCTVEIQERGDIYIDIDVTLQPTSESPEAHLVDEYLTLALMAMIEQRSAV